MADGGALAMTATGATFAALSLSAMSWFPLIVTPPLATPPSTVRVSVTATVSPLLVESWVSMCTTVVPLDGATTELTRPTSSPGMVTTILSFLRVTVEPGMYRRVELSLRPAAWPVPLTMSASGALSRVKARTAARDPSGVAGPDVVTVVCIPALTRTGATVVSVPNVRTTPSVVLTVVVPFSSTWIWNAVPWTVFVEVGVSTA